MSLITIKSSSKKKRKIQAHKPAGEVFDLCKRAELIQRKKKTKQRQSGVEQSDRAKYSHDHPSSPKAARERSLQSRIADAITSFSGRMIFAYVHIVWFGIWILLNTGRFGVRAFDPFPYGLLTMIVSLEAIFLSTFVLISQNRLSEETERRADLDLHIGLLTEHELTRVLQMLDAIQDKMGIVDHDEQRTGRP